MFRKFFIVCITILIGGCSQEREELTYYCSFKEAYDNLNGVLKENATPLIIGKKATIRITNNKIFLHGEGLHPDNITFKLIHKTTIKPPSQVSSHKGVYIGKDNGEHFEVITLNMTNPISFTYWDSSINVIFTGECNTSYSP